MSPRQSNTLNPSPRPPAGKHRKATKHLQLEAASRSAGLRPVSVAKRRSNTLLQAEPAHGNPSPRPSAGKRRKATKPAPLEAASRPPGLRPVSVAKRRSNTPLQAEPVHETPYRRPSAGKHRKATKHLQLEAASRSAGLRPVSVAKRRSNTLLQAKAAHENPHPRPPAGKHRKTTKHLQLEAASRTAGLRPVSVAKRRSLSLRKGNTLLEAALFIPILVTLLVSIEQLGKLTYTYYSVKKALYTAARYIGTQQGVNFCDAGDPNIQAGLNFALTGTTDGSANPLIAGLTPDMLQVTIERYSAADQTLTACDCSNTGCDTAAGGTAPDFLVISIPEGFPIKTIIPFLTLDPILLKPQVKVPYTGT